MPPSASKQIEQLRKEWKHHGATIRNKTEPKAKAIPSGQ